MLAGVCIALLFGINELRNGFTVPPSGLDAHVQMYRVYARVQCSVHYSYAFSSGGTVGLSTAVSEPLGSFWAQVKQDNQPLFKKNMSSKSKNCTIMSNKSKLISSYAFYEEY